MKYLNWETHKNIVVFGIIALVLHYGVLFFMNAVSFWLWAYYAYFMLAAVAVSVMMSHYNAQKPERVGLMFIMSIFIKMLIFTGVFSPILFAGQPLEMHEKINIIVPFALFLILEVLVIMKLLKIQG